MHNAHTLKSSNHHINYNYLFPQRNVNQSNYTNFDPTKYYKRTNFCTRPCLIFDLLVDVHRFIVCASDHYVTPEQTQTKDKTFKHFTVLERSKLPHWCCNWKGQVFTKLTLFEPPKFFSCSSKCKPRPFKTDFTCVEPPKPLNCCCKCKAKAFRNFSLSQPPQHITYYWTCYNQLSYHGNSSEQWSLSNCTSSK